MRIAQDILVMSSSAQGRCLRRHNQDFRAGPMLKTMARWCIQSLGGVSMTDSEGLWPQLIRCAPHLSTVPLISDKVQ